MNRIKAWCWISLLLACGCSRHEPDKFIVDMEKYNYTNIVFSNAPITYYLVVSNAADRTITVTVPTAPVFDRKHGFEMTNNAYASPP